MKFLFFLILTIPIFSIDSFVHLKSDEIIKAELIDENDDSIILIDLSTGRYQIIPKEDVKKITYSNSVNSEEELELIQKKFKKNKKKKKESSEDEPKFEFTDFGLA